jgi:hypothetical protein
MTGDDRVVLTAGRRWGYCLGLVLGVSLLLVILGQVGSNFHIVNRLNKAERLWREKAPECYHYEIDLPGLRRDLFFTPWIVEVDGEQIVSVKGTSWGEPVVPPLPPGSTMETLGPMRIDQLFHRIRSVELKDYYDAYLSKAWDNALVAICRLELPRISHWACERTCKTPVPRLVRIDYDPEWGYPIRLVEHFGDPLGCWTAYKRSGGRHRVLFEINAFRPH